MWEQRAQHGKKWPSFDDFGTDSINAVAIRLRRIVQR